MYAFTLHSIRNMFSVKCIIRNIHAGYFGCLVIDFYYRKIVILKRAFYVAGRALLKNQKNHVCRE